MEFPVVLGVLLSSRGLTSRRARAMKVKFKPPLPWRGCLLLSCLTMQQLLPARAAPVQMLALSYYLRLRSNGAEQSEITINHNHLNRHNFCRYWIANPAHISSREEEAKRLRITARETHGLSIYSANCFECLCSLVLELAISTTRLKACGKT